MLSQTVGISLRISAELIDGDNGFVILSDKLDGSIRLFKETIRLDPVFGPAYLRLAYAYLLLPEYDSSQSFQSMYDLAAETTNAGIAADPEIRETAGTVFGFIHHKCGEWAEADAAFELAANANSVHPLTRNWYSRFLGTVGRRDDALQQARLAYEQAPDNAAIISRLAVTNLWVSDLGAAGKYFDIANGMGQESPIHDLAYALYLIRMEDISAARRFTQTGLEVMFSDNLEILRQQREFPNLLESAGLTEYWAQTGCPWVNDHVQCE